MQRMTKQRASIFELLRQRTDFLTAADVHELLKTNDINIGIATVYRNLQAMAEQGVVDVIRQEGTDTQSFRYCGEEDSHHHHLICRCCGTSVEITGEEFEAWANSVAKEHGFTELNHSLELYGTCKHCTKHEKPHLVGGRN
ncbi:MAG: Fur family transcriptional regulator [Arcanobacterium sp.]|nr:Fur family transcriptional regulator [Arcanobacterium sp.]